MVLGKRPYRRFYNLDMCVKGGVCTEEEANKIEDMIFSKDPEMNKLGEKLGKQMQRKWWEQKQGMLAF